MMIPSKHLPIESLGVWLLAFYVALAMTILVGIIVWLFGEQEVVLKTTWLGWCAIIAIVPVALRLVRRTKIRIIFDRKAWRAGWQKHRRVRLSYKRSLQQPQRKPRQSPRCSVEYPVRVSTDRGHSGFAMIADLSAKGC